MSSLASVTGVTPDEGRRTVADLLDELRVVGVESRIVRVEPLCWVTSDGILIMVGNEGVKIAAGVRLGLRISPALLNVVAATNQTLSLGQIWLADGADHRWSLVWQVTFPFEWATPLGLQRCVYTGVVGHDRLLDPIRLAVRRFGGQDYLGNDVATHPSLAGCLLGQVGH